MATPAAAEGGAEPEDRTSAKASGGNLAPANAKKVCAEQRALPKGMSKKDMPQDGNCLFHAAAYCISKLTKSELIDHHHLRAECVSHLRKHDQRYIHDWDGEMPDGSKADSFDAYCNAMAKPKTWGSSFELQAIARMYDTKFVVFPTVTSPGSFCRPCPTEGTCCCDPFQWHISMSSSLRVSCAKNLSASAPHRRVCLHEVVDARPPFSQHPQRSLVSRPVFTKPHRRAATVWTASGSVEHRPRP